MQPNRHRRRRKIVDAGFQLRLGLHLVAWIYLYIIAFAVVANASSIAALFLADASEPTYVEAMFELRSFARYVAVPLALTTAVMALHGILLTHRVAGPVFRTKAVLRDLARRRFHSEVRFREGDFLPDVAEALTATSQALREDQARVRRMNAETAAVVRELLGAVEAGADAGDVLRIAHNALDATERLDRHLSEPESADGAAARVPVPECELPAAAALAG